jgi:hypothetical protein
MRIEQANVRNALKLYANHRIDVIGKYKIKMFSLFSLDEFNTVPSIIST